MKPAASVTVIVLAAVAAAHALRIAFQVPVVVGDMTLPMWVSVLAVLGPGALAAWLWREQHA